MSQQAPPIPAPTDFSVTWEEPGDDRFFWTWDRMHFPQPMRPLAVTAHLRALSRGFVIATDAMDLPIQLRYQAINGYAYMAAIPRSFDPAEMAELGRKAEATLRPAMLKLEETWNGTFLPELRADIATYRAFDATKATDAELAAHVAWALARLRRQWEIHFLLIIPSALPPVIFADAYQHMTRSTDEFAPYVLLQGLPNKTVDGGLALWRLSREAAATPAVRAALDRTDPAAVFAALEQTAAGRAFAGKFRAYLDEYGWRGEFYCLDESTWVDDPRGPLKILRTYLETPDEASPEAEQARLAAQREAATAAIRERLAGAPPEERGQFEGLLRLAQFATSLSEDHDYYIDQTLVHLARRAFLQAGQRLAARGQLAGRDDVMYLTADELHAAIDGADRRDLRALVEERRAAHVRAQATAPPPALGTPPPRWRRSASGARSRNSSSASSGGRPRSPASRPRSGATPDQRAKRPGRRSSR